ncbi:MAG: trans-sulfuration enzyme family protein, partial [Planctomycetota bacterium]
MAKSRTKKKANNSTRNLATRSIHAGEPRRKYADSLTTPIIQTSTFTFRNSTHIRDYTINGKEHFEYGRYGNPTAQIAERRLANLEGAEDCVVFSSGMSAITTTILSLVQSGDIVITDDSYKKTLEFCRSYLKQFAIGCTIVPFGDYKVLEKAIKKNTRFIFSESPTNPYLNIFDLVRIKEIAEKHNVMTLIDSTFSTPLNQRPIEFGMDLVLQSATKYLAGHNDILAGAVLGNKELIEKIRCLHKSMGGLIDPHCCYLLLRGLKTFPLRVEKQN